MKVVFADTFYWIALTKSSRRLSSYGLHFDAGHAAVRLDRCFD